MRDPAFTRVLDSWLAGSAAAVAPAPMFTPLRLAGVRFPNRVVAAPDSGGADVLAGAGLVLSGFVAVSPEGRISADTPVVDGWTPPARGDALVALQLGHAGRRGATAPHSVGADVPLRDAWPLVSASPLAYGPYSAAPRELDEAGMDEIRVQFEVAARRAAALAVDVLELDFAHGYLLASFLSPLSNRRTDGYGGSLEGRLRFPLAVLEAVRAAWHGPLAVRLSVTDWARRGVSVDEGVVIARALAERGCELVHVAAGQTIHDDRPEYRRGFLTTLSDRVRNQARVPTLVRGHLTTPDDVNTIVAAGRADLCVLDLPTSALERELASEAAETVERRAVRA